MRRLSLLALLVILASGCGIPMVQHSRTVSQKIETTPLHAIELTTSNGGITIEAHDQEFVEMEVTYKAYGKTDEEAKSNCEKMDTEISANDGQLTIATSKPKMNWHGSAHYNLKIPVSCDLKLKSSNGRINTSHVLGNVSAESSNGRVELTGIQGEMFVKTSNGSVKVDDCIGTLDITTSNGSVNAGGDFVGDGNKIRTSNGSVTLLLNPHSSVEFTAHTSNGKISCGIPTQRIIKEGKRDFHAVVGDGVDSSAPTMIAISTSNGSVKVNPLPEQDRPVELPSPTTTEAEITTVELAL